MDPCGKQREVSVSLFFVLDQPEGQATDFLGFSTAPELVPCAWALAVQRNAATAKARVAAAVVSFGVICMMDFRRDCVEKSVRCPALQNSAHSMGGAIYGVESRSNG